MYLFPNRTEHMEACLERTDKSATRAAKFRRYAVLIVTKSESRESPAGLNLELEVRSEFEFESGIAGVSMFCDSHNNNSICVYVA